MNLNVPDDFLYIQQKLANLGPGQYEYNSLVDELNSKHKQKLGRFGKAAQYPDIPSAIKVFF